MGNYKLTDQNMVTNNNFVWEFGKWYRIPDDDRGLELCSQSWFHCYNSPLLAMFFNPIHAAFASPRLFRCHVRGKRKEAKGKEFGYTMMMIPEGGELEVPAITKTQRIAFGILCAQKVYLDVDVGWNAWAKKWLDGSDRTKAAAAAAADAAYVSADAAADAAYVSADAAYAAYAAYSADAAYDADVFNLHAIAKKAMRY